MGSGKFLTLLLSWIQDPKYPVENLLNPDSQKGPWLSCPQDKSGQLRVELQLERAVPIGYIDVGQFLGVGRSLQGGGVGHRNGVLHLPHLSHVPVHSGSAAPVGICPAWCEWQTCSSALGRVHGAGGPTSRPLSVTDSLFSSTHCQTWCGFQPSLSRRSALLLRDSLDLNLLPNPFSPGNSGCAFLQIDVGRSSWSLDKPFVTLLPATMLMSRTDSKQGKNRSGVRMFKHGKGAKEEETEIEGCKRCWGDLGADGHGERVVSE